MMKVVIDRNIPYLKEALEAVGCSVVAMVGTDISRENIVDADALFVRTRTRCDKALLTGTKVRFIGTATIGYDHIDAEYCRDNGIMWSSAPGCNAGAVLQYIQSVIYSRYKSLEGVSLGVIGVGEVGSRIVAWAEAVGMTVYRNDPPKAAVGMSGLVPIEEIAEKCDVITFHPTLEKGGEFPSFHLGNDRFFNMLKCKPLVINASRGAVVDGKALLGAIDKGLVSSVVLDVWENEPEIDRGLLDKSWIATPHIAGYSLEGKYNATRIVLDAFAKAFGIEGGVPMPALPDVDNPILLADNERDAFLKIYSPLKDTADLKNSPSDFENLRNNYALRRENSAYKIVLND